MSKDKEDKPGIISLNEYQDDLEALVKYHTARIEGGKPFRVTKKYDHIALPDFGDDKRAQLDWELEQIDRCKNGFDGMSGRYYFYHNFCSIKHKTRGKIRPDFRASALNMANTIDRVMKTPGRGLVNVKRRQIGMSWYISADNIYDCTFKKNFDIGMNSKSLNDSYYLFTKHKYIHRNLPKFLQTFLDTDRRDMMQFGKYLQKAKKWKGNQSSITSFAPTPTSYAGWAGAKCVHDEWGETDDALAIWSNSEECLKAETERVGTPIFFGTMGETMKAGKALMEFWLKHELYGFDRLGLWGYNSLIMDDWGNDLIEASIRWIIYDRKKAESLAPSVYHKRLQKYPINEDDAFLIVGSGGVGNPIVRSKQYTRIQDNPPIQVKGWMRPKLVGLPDFVPDPNGKIIVYEHPIQGINHGYVAACDPAEEDDIQKSRDNSNLSTAIMAKPFGLQGPRLVVEYTDRPSKLQDYYEQLVMLLQWYNTPGLIEMNRGGMRIKDYIEPRHPKLLSMAPKSPNSVFGGYEYKIGAKMTPATKQQMIALLDSYWEHHWEIIPSLRFIEESGKFGADHADDDLACAVGWCLMLLQADKRVADFKNTSGDPQSHYMKNNGRLELFNGSAILSRPSPKTTNPLFK